MSDNNANKDNPEFIERRSEPFQPPASLVLRPRRPKAESLSPPFQQLLGEDEEQEGIHLRQFFNAIRKHKWKIGAFMVASMIATCLVTLFIPPRYKSTVTINVERRGHSEFVGQQAGQQPSGIDIDQVMTTQVEILKSDSVVRAATEKYHLLDIEKQFAGLSPDEAARLRSSPIKLKRLKIVRVPNTYLIQISYEAPEPQLAADVANEIAASYVTHAFDSRDRSYVQATEAVNRNLRDLQNRMIASGKGLAEFNKQMKVIDPQQRISILSARLLELDKDYTDAQSDRLRKEAVFNSTKSGDLAAAQVSTHAESLQRLIDSLNAARQEFAVVRTTYAENHPEYKKAKNKLTELETQFQELRTNTLQQVQQDYNQARAREDMAYKLVGETKGEIERVNNTAAQYEQLKNEADRYKKLYDDLDRVTREEDINRSFQNAIIQVEDAARIAAQKSFPVMWLNLALAFLLSGLFGIAGAMLHDTLDTKLWSKEDAAEIPNVEVIAALPKMKKPRRLPGAPRSATGASKSGAVVGKLPGSARTKMLTQYYECIRALRNSINFASLDGEARSLLMTSANAGEGKSTIAANLAFSYALLGKRVLLIDADMRRPSLPQLFQVEKKVVHGLAEQIEQKADWSSSLIKVAREHLFLLPAGKMSERSTDLLEVGMQQILEQAYEKFDLVIIDGPPLLAAPEASQLAAVADGVLVVTRAGLSTTKNVKEAYSLLKRARARVVGMVIDEVNDNSMGKYDYDDSQALPKAA